jgi:hypothetical protein
MAGCGESTSDTILILAVISLAISPNPITAEPSANADYTWTATFILTLTESAGTGATIDTVTAILSEGTDGSGGSENVLTDWRVDSTTNRIEGNSSRSITFTVDYTLPGGGREALVDVEVDVTDDNGVELSGSTQATVE